MMFCEDVELSENGVEEVATVQMAFLGGQLQEHILILYGQGLYLAIWDAQSIWDN